MRTQQIILHETGVANTVDPLGGSYFVEELTNRMEAGAFDYFRRIDAYGGMVEAIEAGFPQREIMDAAYRFQRAFDAKEKVMVGVNAFTESVPEDDVSDPDDLRGDGRRAAEDAERGPPDSATRAPRCRSSTTSRPPARTART